MIERTMLENKNLEQLIRRHSSYNNTIYDNTSIYRDLNIQDDLAFDFIEAYSKQFNVDISNFNLIKYFPPITEKSKRIELTVEDLTRGITAGELNDDIIAFDEDDPNLPPQLTPTKIILGILFILAVAAILSVVAIYI